MAFMIRHTGGVVCLSLSNTIADQLDLPLMVERNTSRMQTPYTVSIEAAEGVTTGISASDRAHTVRAAIHPVARPEDLRRPGHVFPLRAQDGGVLVRSGHTEASVDLCRLAGMREGAVISELMKEDGAMMRLNDIEPFALAHDLPSSRLPISLRTGAEPKHSYGRLQKVISQRRRDNGMSACTVTRSTVANT